MREQIWVIANMYVVSKSSCYTQNMPKVSKLFRDSLMITIFFGINKIVALVRQGIIVKQYGFSPEIDAFNVANNVPDLLFALITGGAFAVAFIPVLAEYLHKESREETWLLFSRVANIVFLSTLALSILVGIFAEQLVKAQLGIAPGFSLSQQEVVVTLMRLNLIATLIFSISGLAMSTLQAHKHFFLPAVAPILYNVGQIFGAVVLTKVFGMGIYGLTYGVILGATLHLLVQIPGMIHYNVRWSLTLSFSDPGVKKVLRLMGPRILTILFIQIIFLSRDNLASRLASGSVTALTYAYFVMQVPETLIGSAIATALLPTISQLIHHDDLRLFVETVNRALRAILTLTVIITVLSIVSLQPFLKTIFHFTPQETSLLTWVTIAYLVGLTSQCLLEIATRVYYAKQDAKTPLIATFFRMVCFIGLSFVFLQSLGAVGLALADSLAVTVEMAILLVILAKTMPQIFHLRDTVKRISFASSASLGVFYLSFTMLPFPLLLTTSGGVLAAFIIAIPFIRRELQMLLRL